MSYFNEESFYNKISGVVGEEKAKGRAEGRAEGIAEGIAKGRAEGRAEEKAEGRAEGIAKIVSEMLARNITDSFILENTGLTEDELLSISQK